MIKLTPRQRDVHAYMLAFQGENGKPPTIKQIGAALGMASNNGVHEHLRQLENKGAAERRGQPGSNHCWFAVPSRDAEPAAEIANPGTNPSADGRWQICLLCHAIENGNATCWACVERWPVFWSCRAALLAILNRRDPSPPMGAAEVSAFVARMESIPSAKPYEPDRRRVDRGEYERADGSAICATCGCSYRQHPPVRGYEWLLRLCNGKMVKL